jgi:cob(I)alamin adenosyltransferase
MLHVYTGNGKGKTTAAIGQIVRAAGRGKKVCLVQLFKGEKFYGEQKILQKLKNVDFFSFAPKHPLCFPAVKKETAAAQCARALVKVKDIFSAPCKYDVVVLEEFNIAVRDGYISIYDLLNVLDGNTSKCDVVVTGRAAHKKLIGKADLVTEMKLVKHYFYKGIKARKGIEF